MEIFKATMVTLNKILMDSNGKPPEWTEEKCQRLQINYTLPLHKEYTRTYLGEVVRLFSIDAQ